MVDDTRLDSWKAISAYLGRDVRTLQRWESQGLPIRRAGEGRGASVFAFTTELDAWLRARPSAAAAAEPANPAAPRSPGRHVRWVYIAAVTAILVAFVGWRSLTPLGAGAWSADVTPERVVVQADGREQWRFAFPADVVTGLPDVPAGVVLPAPEPGILVLTSGSVRRADRVRESGVLRLFSLGGALERTFSFHDGHQFDAATYGGAWDLTDAAVSDAGGARRYAVAAHHDVWWPSLVTVLDAKFARTGTFVNSGWVLGVKWLDAKRLAISGFNQEQDAGMIAILDADHLDGASPDTSHGPFACRDCGAARPLFYAVFPRSEVNRVSASRFNGATFDLRADRVIVHTKEAERETADGPVSEALYEFSPEMKLIAANYGVDYWARHKSLELQGKITHTRETCPERNGPLHVKTWTATGGWVDVRR